MGFSFVILTPLLGEGGVPEGRGGYSPLWNAVPYSKIVERMGICIVEIKSTTLDCQHDVLKYEKVYV